MSTAKYKKAVSLETCFHLWKDYTGFSSLRSCLLKTKSSNSNPPLKQDLALVYFKLKLWEKNSIFGCYIQPLLHFFSQHMVCQFTPQLGLPSLLIPATIRYLQILLTGMAHHSKTTLEVRKLCWSHFGITTARHAASHSGYLKWLDA